MNPDDARLFDAYGRSFYDLFQRTGDLADINKAKKFWKASVHLTPEGDPNLAGRLDDLGVALRNCFDFTGNLTDVAEAISCQRRALRLTPENHQDFPNRFMNLGNSLLRRFEHTGNLSEISEAITNQQKAIQLAGEDNASLPSWLSNLGVSLSQRFDKTGDLSDISEAISSQQRAVDLTPQGHARLPDRLANLGSSLLARFDRTGDVDDISKAISLQQKALDLTPDGDPGLPSLLHDLGNSLTSRFERNGALSDITDAISFQQRAVQLTPEGHADLPIWLSGLGNSFRLRFVHTGDVDDIAAAISSHQKAVDLTPGGHARLPSRLNSLAVSYSRRFESTGHPDDISKAIACQVNAIELTPEGNSGLPAELFNLGVSLTRRFEFTGNPSDISEAITYLQKAVYLTPEGHSNLPNELNSLGLSLMRRFQLTKDPNDISEAISSQQKAILLTPEGHADLPTRLHNLGNSLSSRFESTGDLSDMSAAISSLEKAVALTPEHHAQLPTRLNALTISLIRRFQEKADLIDISEAISFQQRAVDLTLESHAKLPIFLNNLGLVLMLRFMAKGDRTDISEAISSQEKVIRLTPEGHANLPTQLMNLGEMLVQRFEISADAADIQSAMTKYRLAASSASGSLDHRLNSARKWAKLSKDFDSSQVLHAWSKVIDLSSHIAGLEYTIEKRYEFLLNTSEISASAAAVAFAHEKPELALEWLEQGRCLVWSQLHNLRTPLDALRAHDQALAEELLRVSKELESAGSRAEPGAFNDETTLIQKMSLQDEVDAHVKLAQRWDQLLEQIRALPGFEDFIKPIPYSRLIQQLPNSGFVVVINVHQDRTDALILKKRHAKPLHIHLAAFSYTDAENLRHALRDILRYHGLSVRGSELDEADRGMRPSRNYLKSRVKSTVAEILRQLWEFVVKPILDTLGFMKAPVPSDMPRIWWCTTGPLAFLPIHAAGIYMESDARALSDFVVSSYTPVVTALVERVKKGRQIDTKKSGLTLICQEDTPGLAPLPGVAKEVRAIEQVLKAHEIKQVSLEGGAATIAEGMKQMQALTCIHFACHAQQNTREPLQSGFYLADGRLSLSSIIKQRLDGADLAFLAACQTSTGDEKLSEEAVHLAAGMLAAGYQGVVATMWAISDAIAPEIAEKFYLNLIVDSKVNSEGKAEGLDGERAAHALHLATREIRKAIGNSDSSLLTWIPYVHFGL